MSDGRESIRGGPSGSQRQVEFTIAAVSAPPVSLHCRICTAAQWPVTSLSMSGCRALVHLTSQSGYTLHAESIEVSDCEAGLGD